jgi:hypothetical protein
VLVTASGIKYEGFLAKDTDVADMFARPGKNFLAGASGDQGLPACSFWS